jgi:hypothetical protein
MHLACVNKRKLLMIKSLRERWPADASIRADGCILTMRALHSL